MTAAQNYLLLKAQQNNGILKWLDLTPSETRVKNTLIKSGHLEVVGSKDAKLTSKGLEALKSFY